MTKDEKLTSVKITQPLYTHFKVTALQENFSFKKLADRCIFLYITDKSFRDKIHKQHNISLDE